MRAAGFEPIETSQHTSTRTGFTTIKVREIWLPISLWLVAERNLCVRISIARFTESDFSNGITTIQCMYAPEFTSHSEGIRVKWNKHKFLVIGAKIKS